MIEPKTLSGFMELLPRDQILFNKMKDTIRKNFESFGFWPIDTPVLESSEVLLAKAGGETEKQIYQFNKGENNLCMRFDFTVPLAKYVAKNLNELTFPFKRYQIGKVYRGERPQKGRFREFYQCDIDVIGKDKLSLCYDAEMPSVMFNIFKELNIGDFTIFVSNRKILLGMLEFLQLQGISDEILRIIDKKEKIGIENVVSILKNDLKITDEKVDIILSLINISGTADEQIAQLEKLNLKNDIFNQGVFELKEVVKYMRDFGVCENNFNINLSIVRGLDYYTGTVYETFLKGHENLGSICGGGRFDNLAGFYCKEKLPGVGMSIGLTRLFHQLKENQLLNNQYSANSDAILLPMGETQSECIKLSTQLRKNGISNFVYLEESKFKQKLNFANKCGIQFAVIVGEDEVNSGYYTLKDLFNFEQKQVSLEELIKLIKSNKK